MKRFVPHTLLALTLLLAACAPTQVNSGITTPAGATVANNDPAPTNQSDPAENELARTDEQGAVTFAVTPLNLSGPTDSLEFDVAMNTHSVDLSMDLATLATLSTDKGVTIPATKWEATPGGHHVDGKLIFPLVADGKSILEGANKLTLTIVNVDAASRVFEWDLK